MPQVDLEASVPVCRGGSSGRKIEPVDGDDHVVAADTCETPADLPPESFWLSKDAEFDWFDRNAFLDRKESTKGNGVNHNHSNSSSQRFSINLKSKAAIIGLPKTQKNDFCGKRRCKPLTVRLFPAKRSESVGKSTAQMTEPSSPKVSCMGRVRSKRSRSRRRRPETGPVKEAEKTKSDRGEKKKGFCSNFLSLFRSDRRQSDGSVVKSDDSSVKSSHRKKKNSKRSENIPVSNEPVMAPGLGGMTRFASGRRSYGTDDGGGVDAARLSVDSDQSATLGRFGSTRRN